MRKPVSPEEQLAITLGFFATGESYASLMYQYLGLVIHVFQELSHVSAKASSQH